MLEESTHQTKGSPLSLSNLILLATKPSDLEGLGGFYEAGQLRLGHIHASLVNELNDGIQVGG